MFSSLACFPSKITIANLYSSFYSIVVPFFRFCLAVLQTFCFFTTFEAFRKLIGNTNGNYKVLENINFFERIEKKNSRNVH